MLDLFKIIVLFLDNFYENIFFIEYFYKLPKILIIPYYFFVWNFHLSVFFHWFIFTEIYLFNFYFLNLIFSLILIFIIWSFIQILIYLIWNDFYKIFNKKITKKEISDKKANYYLIFCPLVPYLWLILAFIIWLKYNIKIKKILKAIFYWNLIKLWIYVFLIIFSYLLSVYYKSPDDYIYYFFSSLIIYFLVISIFITASIFYYLIAKKSNNKKV